MRTLIAVLVIHVLAGCAAPQGNQMCAMQALGQSGQGFLIVRMACRPEGEQ